MILKNFKKLKVLLYQMLSLNFAGKQRELESPPKKEYSVCLNLLNDGIWNLHSKQPLSRHLSILYCYHATGLKDLPVNIKTEKKGRFQRLSSERGKQRRSSSTSLYYFFYFLFNPVSVGDNSLISQGIINYLNLCLLLTNEDWIMILMGISVLLLFQKLIGLFLLVY